MKKSKSMSRIIHVLVIEEDNSECFSIGVIDNITIDCKESFMPRLMNALNEHFDGDTRITSDFIYEDLFGYTPVDLSIEVDHRDYVEYQVDSYNITIAETWLY